MIRSGALRIIQKCLIFFIRCKLRQVGTGCVLHNPCRIDMAGQLPPIRCINVEIRILFPEGFILVFLQIMEHGMILHAVSVNDRITVTEIRCIITIYKDRAYRILVRRKCPIQIQIVVRCLHQRITDLRRLRIEADPSHCICIDLLQFIKIYHEFIFILVIAMYRHFPNLVVFGFTLMISTEYLI